MRGGTQGGNNAASPADFGSTGGGWWASVTRLLQPLLVAAGAALTMQVLHFFATSVMPRTAPPALRPTQQWAAEAAAAAKASAVAPLVPRTSPAAAAVAVPLGIATAEDATTEVEAYSWSAIAKYRILQVCVWGGGACTHAPRTAVCNCIGTWVRAVHRDGYGVCWPL